MLKTLSKCIREYKLASILSPSDLSYIITQLRLTRPLARSSDASLLDLLQHMAMYSPQLSVD